jgi:hypothetical protein
LRKTKAKNLNLLLLQTTGGKDDVRIGMICANYYLMGNKQIYVGKVSDYVFLSVVELDAINNMQKQIFAICLGHLVLLLSKL